MTPEDLIEIEAIKRLKYRYARLLDTKDFDSLSDLFVEDATASYSGGQLSYEGRDAIIGFLRAALGSTTMLTSHLVGQPEIELTGPNSAEGTWALQDMVIVADQGIEIRGTAFYEDRYVKVGGAWKFRHTGYRRVYEEMGPRPPEANITASWWDGGASSIVAREPHT
ncbi:MAG TPA: nuclear transport factor 2 family protein [Actinomycetota bacterium]|nr:nuclear transport factor 2 family protein [Actinomycetota bacterium]